MWRKLACGGAIIIAGACGGKASKLLGDGGAGQSGVNGDGWIEVEPSAMAAWLSERATAMCEREVRCGRMSELETCLELSRFNQLYWRYLFGVDVPADAASELLLGPRAMLDACVREYEDGTCSTLDFSAPSCNRVLRAKRLAARGENCGGHLAPEWVEPCQDGLSCQFSDECLTCEPALPARGLDEECGILDVCEAGLHCASVGDRNLCEPWAQLGDSCESRRCIDSVCNGAVCVAMLPLGARCDEANACQSDLRCMAGACKQVGFAGAACSRDDSLPPCVSGWCVFAQRDALEGICGDPPLAVPGPCPRLGDSEWYCPFRSYADFGQVGVAAPTSCECVPQLPPGSACESDRTFGIVQSGQCADGICRDDVCVALADCVDSDCPIACQP